jgi:putative copper export protein/methionine-rich copper-binding protein CopC
VLPIRRRLAAALVLALAVLAVALLRPAGAGADPAPTTTSPAANAVVRTAPSTITVDATAATGTVSVFAADHTEVASGPLVPDSSGRLVLGLPVKATSSPGVYSVVWTAGTQTGTFAFDVDPKAAPATVTNPAPQTPLGPLSDGVIAWTTWVTLMGTVGLALLALLVARPARRAGPEVLARATTRLARAGALLALLAFPAVLTDLANGDDGIDYGAAWSGVFDGSNDGRLIGIELVGIGVAFALLVPLTLRRVAAGPARVPLLGLALAAGAVALGTTKFPDAAPEQGRDVFDAVMWQFHLMGGGVWIGGLIGLLLLLLPGVVPAGARAAFWSPAIRRFSAAAMGCVALIALSGLWLYWGHVDGPSQLLTTMYGRVLGVKLLIFGTMLALGAVNQFWLHPKLDRLRAAGDDRPVSRIVAREFRGAIALEVLLGVAVVMVAPFLHGSARNQAFQAHATLTSVAPDGVAFTPSGLEPGLTDYTVTLPDGDAKSVSVTFASPALAVPATTVAARRIGPSTYRVRGFYTPQVGDWQVAVTADGTTTGVFPLAVSTEPEPPKLDAKPISTSTWVYGSLETVGVVLAMVGGFVVSGRVARRRRPGAASVPDDAGLAAV